MVLKVEIKRKLKYEIVDKNFMRKLFDLRFCNIPEQRRNTTKCVANSKPTGIPEKEHDGSKYG